MFTSQHDKYAIILQTKYYIYLLCGVFVDDVRLVRLELSQTY